MFDGKNPWVSCRFSQQTNPVSGFIPYLHGFAEAVSPQVRANSEMRWDIFAHTWDEDLHDAMLGRWVSGYHTETGDRPNGSQWRWKT